MTNPATLESLLARPDGVAQSEAFPSTSARFQPAMPIRPEKFIQVDRDAIIRQVLDKLFDPNQRPLASEVINYICILRQTESAKSLDELITLYDPFNPDDETVNIGELSGQKRKTELEAIKERVIDLADSANFIEINENGLKAIFEEDFRGGFSAEVDLAEYDFHLLYYRGAIHVKGGIKTWRRLWLFEEETDVDGYRRLFLALKLKPHESRVAELMKGGFTRRRAEKAVRQTRKNQMLQGVSDSTLHLKVFRKIPQSDLRILFPNAQIRFTLFDKLWLWLGSGGSTVFAIVMAVLKTLALVVISPLVLILTVSGAVGAVFRTVANFFNTRTRYMAKLAKSLYFHSIASNQSVLTLLTDEAEEEDLKEAILTYALLLRYGQHGRLRVKQEAEKFLKDEFEFDCDFDVDDGFKHLEKLGLLVDSDSDEPRYRGLDDAREYLAGRWAAIPAEV